MCEETAMLASFLDSLPLFDRMSHKPWEIIFFGRYNSDTVYAVTARPDPLILIGGGGGNFFAALFFGITGALSAVDVASLDIAAITIWRLPVAGNSAEAGVFKVFWESVGSIESGGSKAEDGGFVCDNIDVPFGVDGITTFETPWVGIRVLLRGDVDVSIVYVRPPKSVECSFADFSFCRVDVHFSRVIRLGVDGEVVGRQKVDIIKLHF
jgi:hypothetical protein